ncbi:thiamine phosphate phosphatase-like protein [Tanacetum coccineum]
MNTRFWTSKDVTRSKEFIHAIERRLKTRRIFRNLECFVSGRVRDIDYRLLQRTKLAHHLCIQSYKVGKVRYDIKKSKYENKGLVSTEIELELEQTQQGSSHEVSLVDIEKVVVRSSLQSLKPKRTIRSRAKRSSINLIGTLFHVYLPFTQCEYKDYHKSPTQSVLTGSEVKMEMEIPHSSGVYFITACSYSTDTYKDLMKAQVLSDANQFFIEMISKNHGVYDCFSEIITNLTVVDKEGRLRIFPYHGDLAQLLKLRKEDHVMPRNDFPLHNLILKSSVPVKPEVHEWSDEDELNKSLLRLIDPLEA